MARHRDIRNMDYADEYEGYDDVYGHSVDDDYYISPSNRQFIYNREASRENKFEHKDDIQEADEVDELSDVDRARLNSCIDEIVTTLDGPNITKSELAELVLKHKFDVESVINTILEDSKYQKPGGMVRDKDDTVVFFNKIEQSNTSLRGVDGGTLFSNKTNKKSFVVPDIFGSNKSMNKPSNFEVPNIFGVDVTKSKSGGEQNKVLSSLNVSNNASSSNTTKRFNIPNIFGSGSKTEIQADIFLPKQLNNLHLKDSPVKVQSLGSTQAENPLNIDLTLALKATKSLPNFRSNKGKENLPSKFEIPYIEGDYQVDNKQKVIRTIKRKILPCALNVSHLARECVTLRKKPSRFGRVLVRKYRNLKSTRKMYAYCQDFVIPNKIKVFRFNTQSPDDYISSHLSR